MNIIELLENFKKNEMSTFVTEAIILELLELHTEKQGKEFLTNYIIHSDTEKKGVEFEGFAPQGFDNFVGPTAIDIRLSRNPKALRIMMREKSRIYSSILSSEDKSVLKNLLVIVPTDITEEDKKKIEFEQSDFSFNFYLWSISELHNLFNKYPEFTSELENNPSKALVNQVFKTGLSTSRDEWKIKRDKNLHNLGKCFRDDDLVLFLGAGVSLDAKIPTWNDLMSNLMVSLVNTVIKDNRFKGHVELTDGEKEALIEAIQKKNGNSPLQLVRFIRNGLGDLFREELRKILYKKCKDTSRILEAITDLSVPVRHGIGIQGIVTYNFDDLIELNFKNKKVIRFHPIFKEADIPSKNELGIFHVHGFLPRNPAEYDGLEDKKKEKESLLVFSEEEYHQLMLDPYHWANLVQLNYFRERTCLFIGVSMTDPNVRRLLEIARQKQPEQDECKHYIILQRDLFNSIQNGEGIDGENIKKFAMVNQKLKEAELSELGLNVIWVDEHDEIPNLLDELRK